MGSTLKAQPSLSRRVWVASRCEEDEIREDLVALVLEVVLGRPQRVVAQLVHVLGYSFEV